MATIESQMENLSPEELAEIVTAGEGRYLQDDRLDYSAGEIEEVFRYMYAVTLTQDHEEGARVLAALKLVLDHFAMQPGNEEKALDYHIEWSLVAIRLTAEDKNEFKCMPIYLDLFDLLAKSPQNQRWKQARIRLQLAYHFDFWLKKGGDVDALTEEDFQLLNHAEETFLSEAAQFLEEAEASGNTEAVVALKRSMARFYSSNRKPNDALKWLKEIAEDVTRMKDFHVADQADVYMEIGKVYLDYKKFQTALKYFEMAKDVYLSQGPDWEMIAMQAEGHIEQCKLHLE